MSHPTSKEQLLSRSIIIAAGLTFFKMAVSMMTHSMSIMASAVDSLMDVAISLANWFFVRSAAKPADKNHPYGHGKIESLAGLLQSLLMGGIAIGVGAMAVYRFYYPKPIEQPLAGILITAGALGINLWHTWNLRKSMIKTESQVMATEFLHYASDTIGYIGVLISFLIFEFTGSILGDLAISILIVLFLLKNIWNILRGSLSELLDEQLPDAVLHEINQSIRSYHPKIVGFHDLRTRKVGQTKFIEFHVVLRDVAQFEEAHSITEGLTSHLRTRYPGSIVTVHTDREGAVDPSN